MNFTLKPYNQDNMNLAIAQVNAIYGEEKIFINPDVDDPRWKRVELSIPSFNKILSNHYWGNRAGFALGAIYNFYGWESLGKSAAGLYIAGELYKQGLGVHWIDGEGSFDADYAKEAFGLNVYDKTGRCSLSNPINMEQALDTVVSLVNNEAVNLIVFDSIASFDGEEAIEKSAGEKSMAIPQRLLSQHFPKFISKARRSDIAIIYINQLRANIKQGMAYGSKATGGNAMKFFPHVSLSFKKPQNGEIYKGDDYVGTEIEITGEKNKTSRPKLFSSLMLYPGEGFSREADIINLAVKAGVIKKSGTWFSFNGENIGQGIDNVRSLMMQNPELTAKVWDATKVILEPAIAPVIDIKTGEIISEAPSTTEAEEKKVLGAKTKKSKTTTT